jgi:hypothetical protein
MHIISGMWNQIQSSLFPHLDDILDDPLTEKLRQVVAILEIVRVEEHAVCRKNLTTWRMGRKPLDRRALARAFVVKAVYDLPTTEMLIERLRFDRTLRRICGWERRDQLPSAATFSRAFAEFAHARLGDEVHYTLVRAHVGERVIMHISRDSTAITAREKPAKKEPRPPKGSGIPGRPKKGETRITTRAKSRLPKQLNQTADEAIAELPTACDCGVKRDSTGHTRFWNGYKLHLDIADGGFPITALTTSASMHDSQAAIPLAKRTHERAIVLYEVMDSAYDAQPIRDSIIGLGHRPIIEHNRRKGQVVPFDPATAQRYKVRTHAERANSRLKDEFGAEHVRVRGHAKVHLHLMFGVLALFADQLLKVFIT